jgi:tRNA (mo5U34)-methyltransferase
MKAVTNDEKCRSCYTVSYLNTRLETVTTLPNDITFARVAGIAKRVKAMPYWYHRIELPGGLVTPGWAPLNPEAYKIPERLDGKRVLVIGAWDGYWTFEALKRGAEQVVAIDDFSDLLSNLEDKDRAGWDTFELCREILGYDEEHCQHHDMSLYDLTPDTFGRFDLVFCFGVLYHLRHPLLGLDKIAEITDEVFIESAILDDFSAYRGGINTGYPGEMVMEFYPEDNYGNNQSNWWAPSLTCLDAMLSSAGFTETTTWKLTDNPTQVSDCRGFAHARRA